MDREISVEVSLPSDEDGMMDRECPNCDRVFQINTEEFENGHYLNLRCPYCGWIEDSSKFSTGPQEEYTIAITMGEQGPQLIEDILENELGDLADFSDTQPVAESIPSPFVDEDFDNMVCSECDFTFGIIQGESGSCPVCR
ncbi:hypothetical protein GWK26_08720 [haloarchaeon 3A1-DGR]|nr:hypothetical protein GWK26_08720 [haloarchaeon 3A1-DGR]